ncbi:MAG: hypothetical protein MAG453_01371 [Calditrichaeota bacterium]|nr:hypothetical protein [Calditrichota bacterium]
MRRMIAILLVGLLACGTAVAGLEMESLFSEQLDEERDILIYTPPNYNPGRPIGYPLIVSLHSTGMTPADLNTDVLETALDLAIIFGVIDPVIIAMPDGSTPEYWDGSFWMDSELYGAVEKYLIHDVISWVDEQYHTVAEPWRRAIHGYSMGGFGAMRLAVKYPQLSAAVASNSGPLDPDALLALTGEVIDENDPEGEGPPYEYDPDAGEVTSLLFSMAGALSPNLDNDPPVDFPLDENGEVLEGVWNQWAPNFPSHLVGDAAERFADLDVFFDVGTEDEFNLLPSNEAFADTMDAYGYEYTFETFAGGHYDQFDDRLMEAVEFLDGAFDEATEEPGYLVLLPYNETVPAEGGVLEYSATGINNVGQTLPGLHYWVKAELPDGSLFGPVFDRVFVLPANAHMQVDLSIQVPEGAPAGGYRLVGHIGPAVNDEFVTSSYAWSKAEGGATATAGGWVHSPWPGAGNAAATVTATAESELPGAYAVSDVYPNPFNPTAALSVTLPEPSELSVTVYDALGREVATLADGTHTAGRHEFVLDGSARTNGVYFVRATVPGELNAVRKAVLVK